MHLCNGLIQWNSGSKFSLRACHYQDELSFWGVIPIESGSLCQGSAADLLVELGQLPTQGDTAVRAEGGGEVLQRGEELVGSLVKEYGATVNDETESNVIANDILALEKFKLYQLSPQRRIVYLMNRFQNKTVSEISEELSLSRRTVENHLQTGRNEVREFIRQCI